MSQSCCSSDWILDNGTWLLPVLAWPLLPGGTRPLVSTGGLLGFASIPGLVTSIVQRSEHERRPVSWSSCWWSGTWSATVGTHPELLLTCCSYRPPFRPPTTGNLHNQLQLVQSISCQQCMLLVASRTLSTMVGFAAHSGDSIEFTPQPRLGLDVKLAVGGGTSWTIGTSSAIYGRIRAVERHDVGDRHMFFADGVSAQGQEEHARVIQSRCPAAQPWTIRTCWRVRCLGQVPPLLLRGDHRHHSPQPRQQEQLRPPQPRQQEQLRPGPQPAPLRDVARHERRQRRAHQLHQDREDGGHQNADPLQVQALGPRLCRLGRDQGQRVHHQRKDQ